MTLLTDVECGRPMRTRCPENCETGAGECSTGIHDGRTGVHAGLPGCGGCYYISGGTKRPRGVSEMLASNRIDADTAASSDTHINGDFVGTPMNSVGYRRCT